jgi:hypothetical protein
LSVLTAAAARTAADDAARRVLAAETEYDLRLEDYVVEVTQAGEGDAPAWDVRYVHANPQVPFVRPTGHPMHFTVRVGPGADQVDVTPGE